MGRKASADELKAALVTRADLVERGWTRRRIDTALAERQLHRVRQNVYIDGNVWQSLWPECQHLAEVLASASQLRKVGAVAAYGSAAVALGIPLWRFRPRSVEVIIPGPARASTSTPIRRHLDRLTEDDVTEIHGIRCTTLERTVFDLARTTPAETAISAMDAALGAVAVSKHVQDEEMEGRWRERMTMRLADAKGARGVVQARRMVSLADGLAESPGECVSRLQLLRLGFARPRLQVPVPAPGGGCYFVDIGLDDAGAFGEFDGVGKYLDEAIRRGLTLEQVLLEEKRREDWIRGITQRRFARWGEEHILTPTKLRARLAAFSIHPPR